MRTKEYDVQFNDGRLSIVRLRDGAPVVDSVEIPADAVGAAVAVLSSVEVARIEDADKGRKVPPAEERPTGAEPTESSRGSAKSPAGKGRKKKATE